ncbi:Oidioi.mRNA.OKI2018_I69.PAR.g9104.t1.cds [Oikopleura dioica]|uniref:Oidioi.mRNA.OKI2018_I69.PAR.g9104.t1.cds n=1 Tax=Oikopleura dioica TaxID=34765 RepID=A0ABN7RK22_OIKDI|nr:Oidioi.mRNA.OKI2018_I69.PAR.g9104.t1.cds [Oikopleura dioica]
MKKLWFFTFFSFASGQERNFQKDLIQALIEEHEGPYEIQRLRRATTIQQINAAAVALTRSIQLTYDTIEFVSEVQNRSENYWTYVTTDLAKIQNWDELIAMEFIDQTSSLMRFFVDFIDEFVFEIDDIIDDLCNFYNDFYWFEDFTGFDICGNNFESAKNFIDILDNIVEFIELHYQLIEMFFDLYVNRSNI